MSKKSKKAREAAKAQDAAETLLSATVVESGQTAEVTEPAEATVEEPKAKRTTAKKKPRGRGVGARAKELILGRPELSFQQIADLVNAEIEGARATANSCRWYAMDLRRRKIAVPDRLRPTKPGAPEPETPADGGEGVEA